MGIRPCVIPEKFLQEQLEIINNAYENLGYSWTREGVQGYQQDHALRKDQINEQFHKDAQRLIPIVKNWLGVDIQIPYRMKFVDEDAYWTNWVSTDDTGSLLLQFNINERQKWVKGITEYQVLHELGTHAIQSALMKKAIGDGTLGPLLGLTSTFSFEQFQMEGMAETLFYFLPESPYSSEYGLISQYYENISFLTWNNAHVMANNAKPTSEIVAYVQSYLPHVTDDNIAKAIRERTQNPLDRTYQYIYGIATYYFMQIASLLQSPERKKDFMVDMFTNVYTPQTILSRFDLPN